MTKPCVDCVAEGVTTRRPTNGAARKPRCATHQRAWKKRAALHAHGQRIQTWYGMPRETYDALYEAQGGRCFICRIANGKTKSLAVDHDHNCREGHPPDRGCPRCWRALVCGRCNRLVAFLGSEALQRAIELQMDPPAQRFLRSWFQQRKALAERL